MGGKAAQISTLLPYHGPAALPLDVACIVVIDDYHGKMERALLAVVVLSFKYNQAAFKLCFAFTTTENTIRQRAP
jgi:hypothetical protein